MDVEVEYSSPPKIDVDSMEEEIVIGVKENNLMMGDSCLTPELMDESQLSVNSVVSEKPEQSESETKEKAESDSLLSLKEFVNKMKDSDELSTLIESGESSDFENPEEIEVFEECEDEMSEELLEGTNLVFLEEPVKIRNELLVLTEQGTSKDLEVFEEVGLEFV